MRPNPDEYWFSAHFYGIISTVKMCVREARTNGRKRPFDSATEKRERCLATDARRPAEAGEKSYMWVYTTAKQDKRPAVVFDYRPSRSGDCAKANGLDIYKYFNYILTLMPGMDWHNHPRLLEKLLPWSDKAKLYCADKTKSDED